MPVNSEEWTVPRRDDPNFAEHVSRAVTGCLSCRCLEAHGDDDPAEARRPDCMVAVGPLGLLTR